MDTITVRVDVQLIETANGRQLRVDRYEAPARELDTAPDAIAARIARSLASRLDEPPPDHDTPSSPTFRPEGPLWMVAFDGMAVRLGHQKGFIDLRQLLSRPGREMHCLELADRPVDAGADAPLLDDRARREIGARIRELQRDIEQAEAIADGDTAARAREELDQLVHHLSGALGLSGRARRLGSTTERARSAVTWRIRSAIRKIASFHPRLGRHLENGVRTGTFCVYQPETPISWAI